MVQDFINKQFYNLFIFTFIFGLVLYGTIGFEGIDEICALVLLIMFIFATFQSPDWSINKAFLTTLAVFIFYTIYSLYIKSNSAKGIFMDLIIQFKPYLAFFAVYYMRPVFSPSQKRLLISIIFIIWGIMLVIGGVSVFNLRIIKYTVGHVAYFAAIITASSLIYLYCSEGRKIDKVIFLLILATGLFSLRSKFYGFFIMSTVITIFFSNISKFKINIKTILILALSLFSVIMASRQKIVMYFGNTGDTQSIPEGFAARAMLYITSVDILKDFFPFGSGFGSFGSFASGVYYSPIYSQYGIEHVKGMTKNNYSYIADTYYPCLAQFGVVGVLLYFGFFLFILRKSYQLYQISREEKYFIIPFLIIIYLLIDNIADATFTSHRGFFIMMLLGLVLSEYSGSKSRKTLNE